MKEFKVSGIYEGTTVSMTSCIYVSQEFIESTLSGIDQSQIKKDNGFIGLISLQVKLTNSLSIEKN